MVFVNIHIEQKTHFFLPSYSRENVTWQAARPGPSLVASLEKGFGGGGRRRRVRCPASGSAPLAASGGHGGNGSSGATVYINISQLLKESVTIKITRFSITALWYCIILLKGIGHQDFNSIFAKYGLAYTVISNEFYLALKFLEPPPFTHIRLNGIQHAVKETLFRTNYFF
jgi:hypothetical protein